MAVRRGAGCSARRRTRGQQQGLRDRPTIVETPEIGAHMRQQRDAIGLDAPTVAELAGIQVERLLQLESGATPTVWELSSIAAALAMDATALRTGDLNADPRKSSARFRAPGGINLLTPLDVRTLARVAEAARIHRFLRLLLGEQRGPVEAVRSVQAIDTESPIWKQGYKLGQHAREWLAPSHVPIASVQRLLEKHGVLVVFVELDSASIAGASLYEADASPAILLNRTTERVRSRLARRAVLAHELCHLLHDSTRQEDLLTVVSREKDRSAAEQRANAFAPSFLAPSGWVARRRLPPRDKVLRIARDWGLTFDGAAWHAKNLKHIRSETAEKLPREFVDAGDFESDVPRSRPSRIGLEIEVSHLGDSALGDLAVRAARSDLISAGRAAEILTLT